MVYKLILLGDGAVGKTSLKKQYLGKGFSNDYLPTLGVDFTVMRYGPNDVNALQIWDLAGQPGYESVRKAYYAGTGAALLIYDLTRSETLRSLSSWMVELLANRKSLYKMPVVLVGNKNDLEIDPEENIRLRNEAKRYASRLTMQLGVEVPYYVTSAKSGENVKEMFEWLIDKLQLVVQ